LRLYNYLENVEVLQTNVRRFDMEIRGVTSRSDEVQCGYVFVCIRGMHRDGHDLASVAKEKGASLLVVEQLTLGIVNTGLPYIRVENTRSALALMCAAAYGNPERQLKMIGVTGTNGKTSTCQLLSAVYAKSGENVKTVGTLDGGLTTPDPEDFFPMLKKAFDTGMTTVIMEASSHALFLDKLYGVKFRCGLFTNLTEEHLDFHKNMNGYAAAKAKLFKSCEIGLFNLDDSYCSKVKEMSAGRSLTYSVTDKNADFCVENYISHGTKGFEYDLLTPTFPLMIKSHLCGRFNVYNTLAAASLAFADGVDHGAIEAGIRSVENVRGRLERLDFKDVPFEVYIDYAHTPDALQKVLECIRAFKSKKQKITLVFGCGGDRDRSKRRLMGQTASRLADFVIVTSDNCRTEKREDIICEILKGIDKERPYKVIEDRKNAIEYAVENAKENDIILLAGKGHEDYEIGPFGKSYFNEKEIAANAVDKRVRKK